MLLRALQKIQDKIVIYSSRKQPHQKLEKVVAQLKLVAYGNATAW